MSAPLSRKLAAILSADAENFSGRMETDEALAFAELRAARAIIDTTIARFGGRIANTAGDGLIAEFPSVVQCVQAAVSIQQELFEAEVVLPFRIGLHMGDVIEHEGDLLGDGVNLAARVQDVAAPGSVLVTQQVFDQMHGKIDFGFEALGTHGLKNMSDPVPLYAVVAPGLTEITGGLDTPAAEAPRGWPVKRVLWVCAALWAFLSIRVSLFGAAPATPWIGLAIAIFGSMRLITHLETKRGRKGAWRAGIIGLATLITFVLADSWLLWPVMPLVLGLVFIGLRRWFNS